MDEKTKVGFYVPTKDFLTFKVNAIKVNSNITFILSNFIKSFNSNPEDWIKKIS